MAKRFMLLTFIALCMLGSTKILHAEQAAEQAALSASSTWMNLVDEGKYLESWDAASHYFKTTVTKEQWLTLLKATRLPLGKVVTRKIKSKQYTKTLPGAPDGEYVVIQYEASFENKKSAFETVTPMRDKDGKWRVSGYYIK